MSKGRFQDALEQMPEMDGLWRIFEDVAITAPLLSVIIPTYNWSSVLPFSIGSVLRQSFTNFEVLVVGDGCTDDSEAVVESIGDDRVRWINLAQNSGHQSVPNNEGLRQSRGELIAYLGHDDLWLPDHLKFLTATIESGYDLVYGITGAVSLNKKSMDIYPSPPEYVRGLWIPPTGVVHRREVTEKVGGWQHYLEVMDDPEVDLWQRAYDAQYRFAMVPRLTAVKFPAALRKDAYKIRSCAEQTHWTQRILNEPDFEAVELMNLLLATLEDNRSYEKHKSYKDVLRVLASDTYARVLGRLSSLSRKGEPIHKGHKIAQYRKYKGLGD